VAAAHSALRLEAESLGGRRARASEARDALAVCAADLAAACAQAEAACAEAADAGTDLAPLRRLREAGPALHAECRQMDLRAGVLSQRYLRAGQSDRPGSCRHGSSKRAAADAGVGSSRRSEWTGLFESGQ
jgi:hypothetical protein